MPETAKKKLFHSWIGSSRLEEPMWRGSRALPVDDYYMRSSLSLLLFLLFCRCHFPMEHKFFLNAFYCFTRTDRNLHFQLNNNFQLFRNSKKHKKEIVLVQKSYHFLFQQKKNGFCSTNLQLEEINICWKFRPLKVTIDELTSKNISLANLIQQFSPSLKTIIPQALCN